MGRVLTNNPFNIPSISNNTSSLPPITAWLAHKDPPLPLTHTLLLSAGQAVSIITPRNMGFLFTQKIFSGSLKQINKVQLCGCFLVAMRQFGAVIRHSFEINSNPKTLKLSLSTQTFRNALDHLVLWLPVYLNSFFFLSKCSQEYQGVFVAKL